MLKHTLFIFILWYNNSQEQVWSGGAVYKKWALDLADKFMYKGEYSWHLAYMFIDSHA